MELHKKSILMIVFFLIVITCNKTNNTETEPNNSFANANPVEINTAITGLLDSENDIDYYVISFSQEQVLRIELSGIKGVNHAINIYKNSNSGPQLLKNIDDNRKSAPETFANLYVQPGLFYICVLHGERDIKKGNTESPYKLLITSRAWLDEEKEPNDNPGSATDITGKKSIKGFFSPARNNLNTDSKNKMQEDDWYKFNADINEGRPILIDLHLSAVEGIDSVVSLYNSDMEEIIKLDNTGTGEEESVTDIGITTSGIYYIQINSKNFQYNHDKPYELNLTIKDYDPSAELEPNNTFEKANIIQQRKINGKINYSCDIDFYKYNPEEKNRYYRIKCLPGKGIDPVINIYDLNKNKLYSINNNGSGLEEVIPCQFITNPIYISVSSSTLNTEASYYSLEIESISFDLPCETEPNNSKSTANLINRHITGFINYKNDTDYYLIKTSERKKVKIKIKGILNGKLKISITDPLGFIIKSKDVESDKEIIFTDTVDKKGYLIVEPLIANYEFPYTITVEE